jgi:hypothetical protein
VAARRLIAPGRVGLPRPARVRNYFYTPDVIEEVYRELSVPFRSSGPRYGRPTT